MPELKRCPFCGGEAFIYPNSSGLIDENWPRGKCYCCNSMGPVSNHLNDEHDAARKWNTRITPKDGELREALVEARRIVFSDAEACKAFRGPDELSEPERVLEIIDRALSPIVGEGER